MPLEMMPLELMPFELMPWAQPKPTNYAQVSTASHGDFKTYVSLTC